MAHNYSAQWHRLIQRYLDEGGEWPTKTRDIAAWAIDNGHWRPQRSPADQCANEISKALREDVIVDAQGRNVRAKHAVRTKQGVLWDDIRSASPDHMRMAFQQRRQGIVGDCRQLKTDLDSFNQNYNADRPIQMSFNFTEDLAELEASEDNGPPLAA